MIKKFDRYIFYSFIGRFFIIFCVLFFLFLMSFIWQKLADLSGKGVGFSVIAKAIFYLGLSYFRMVLPLSILLTTIMTFGGLGEHYELAAIRSTGNSLWRIMRSLFIFSLVSAIISFYFCDNIATETYKKARNLQNSILKSQAALAIEPGVFSDINGYPIRVQSKEGEKLKGVYLFLQKNLTGNLQTIIARNGTLTNHDSLPVVTLTLYKGYIYKDEFSRLSYRELKRQPGNKIAFDTLVQRFDIKNLLDQTISDKGGFDNHYKMLSIFKLGRMVDTLQKKLDNFNRNFDNTTQTELTLTTQRLDSLKSEDIKNTDMLLYSNDTLLSLKQKINVVQQSINRIKRVEENFFKGHEKEVERREKINNRYRLEQFNRFAYAIECIVMFLIAAPLGAIIRKGGLGMPLIVGITIFIIFYLLETGGRNWAINGLITPFLGAMLPVLVLFPLSLYLMLKANKDSEVFNQDKYIEPFRKIYKKLKPEKIHSRYQ